MMILALVWGVLNFGLMVGYRVAVGALKSFPLEAEEKAYRAWECRCMVVRVGLALNVLMAVAGLAWFVVMRFGS